MAQATCSSPIPSSKNVRIVSSNRPVFSRSEMMIGLLVAPVAPSAMFRSIRSGSTESSHSFVPDAISDLSDMPGIVPLGSPPQHVAEVLGLARLQLAVDDR